jgi:hypothetical protein
VAATDQKRIMCMPARFIYTSPKDLPIVPQLNMQVVSKAYQTIVCYVLNDKVFNM